MEVCCNAVEALINGDREAQLNAAQEMIDMKSKQRQRLAEMGVIPPLILMMRCDQDEDVAGLGLYALLSLAFGSERNKVRIVRSGAVPVLCQMLERRSLGVMEQAVTGLMILSSCSSNKVAIAASGAVQLLIEILDYSSCVSEQAKLDAISALLNLSTCPHLIPSLVSSGVVNVMVGVLFKSDKSFEIVEKATELMEKLVCSSSAALEEVANADGATQQLIETMEEGSEQCREHALGTLLVLCRSCRDKYRGLFLREGIMPGLLQVSVDGTWRGREMGRELLEILRDGGSKSSCVSVNSGGKGELVERIMEEIDSRGEKGLGRTLRLVEKMIAKLKA